MSKVVVLNDRSVLKIAGPDAKTFLQGLVTNDIGRLDNLKPVLTVKDVVELQRLTASILVEESVARYILAIVQGTRNNEFVQLGASPRSSVSFYEACQARALVEGRDYVTPDDVRQMAIPILSHRILVRSRDGNPIASARARSRIIHEILKQVPVPE